MELKHVQLLCYSFRNESANSFLLVQNEAFLSICSSGVGEKWLQHRRMGSLHN